MYGPTFKKNHILTNFCQSGPLLSQSAIPGLEIYVTISRSAGQKQHGVIMGNERATNIKFETRKWQINECEN